MRAGVFLHPHVDPPLGGRGGRFQETSAILWEKFDEFKPGTNFRLGLPGGILSRLWFRQRQKKVAIPFGEEFFRLVAAETASQEGLLEEQHLVLADCVQRLTAPTAISSSGAIRPA